MTLFTLCPKCKGDRAGCKTCNNSGVIEETEKEALSKIFNPESLKAQEQQRRETHRTGF